MPLIAQLFDDAIRFRLTTAQKRKLYREAKRRNVSGADLLRELIDTLPEPEKKPRAEARTKETT
jgi:hypothetical protein